MVVHKQFCDLDPAKPESEKENKFIGPSSSLSALWKTKMVYYLFTFASPQFGIKPENLKESSKWKEALTFRSFQTQDCNASHKKIWLQNMEFSRLSQNHPLHIRLRL